MKLILKNSSLIFSKFEEDLSQIFSNFDETKHGQFMQILGGKEGAIWEKIKLLYMPIYSTPTDGNIYYDLKSGKVVGFVPSIATTFWNANTDVNDSSIHGYTETLNASPGAVTINIKSRGIALNSRDVCYFGLSTHNPNPSNSLMDALIRLGKTGSQNIDWALKNVTATYNFAEGTGGAAPIVVQQSKTVTGFGKVMAVCTSNVDGVIGLVSNNGSNATASSYTVPEGYEVTHFLPCGRESSNGTIYGMMFSIQGLAKGLTVSEAETVVQALEVFLA